VKPVEKVWGKNIASNWSACAATNAALRRLRKLHKRSCRHIKTQDKATPGLPYPHFYPQAKRSIFGPLAANSVHNRDGDIFVNNHEETLNNRYKTHCKTR